MPIPSFLVSLRLASSLDDLRYSVFWRAVVAEALGTLLLVFIGCGSCLSWEDPNRSPKSDYYPVIQIAFCFGISVATIVWGIGNVSGGHINPAVTSAFLITRRISLVRAVLYIGAQCSGAILGAIILKSVVPSNRWGSLGNTMINKEMEERCAIGVEFMITFVLVFTVFASCDGKRTDLDGSAPLSIGLSVTMCHLFAIPITGSSMNSARSFGPAVAMSSWEQHGVYWLGPIFGGVVAGLLYEYVFAANASFKKTRQLLLASKYDREDFPAYEQHAKIIYHEIRHEEEMKTIVDKQDCKYEMRKFVDSHETDRKHEMAKFVDNHNAEPIMILHQILASSDNVQIHSDIADVDTQSKDLFTQNLI